MRLRHLREVSEAHAEEMADARPRFEALANDKAKPRVVSSFNLFQTPPELADQLAGQIPHYGRTLEPSAGLGRLYHAIRKRKTECPITLVDISADCAGELYRITEEDRNASLFVADFLTLTADKLGTFDSIVMNPPFKMGTDIKHIRHALTLLAPGGTLVSLCYAGSRQRTKLADADQWIDLPAGSFKSEGTHADTAIVVYKTHKEDLTHRTRYRPTRN